MLVRWSVTFNGGPKGGTRDYMGVAMRGLYDGSSGRVAVYEPRSGVPRQWDFKGFRTYVEKIIPEQRRWVPRLLDA